jgi:WD40 repeat protein
VNKHGPIAAPSDAGATASAPTEPQLWPVFICYRQVDGLAAARRLHELIDKRTVTGPKGEPIQLDVYLDQTMPAAADWREIHRPYLEKARALIVICTPGAKIIEGPDDWVHTEIKWWLAHRGTAPILVDPLGQGIRYVPTAIRDRWPESQRIRLVEAEWTHLPPAELEEKASALRRQIIGNILPSGAAIYEEELQAERHRARQLTRALATAIAMLALTGLATWYAFTKQGEAERSQAEAEESRATATASARVATQERDKALTAQSQFLTDLARQQRTGGDSGTALLLALEALPDTARGVVRPYVPEAERELDGAWRALQERVVLKGHDGIVLSAAFSPDGKRIVTGSADTTARLWDAETGDPVGAPLDLARAPKPAVLTADQTHTDWVASAAFSSDGKRIVTTTWRSAAQLWDVQTREYHPLPLRDPYDAVRSAAFSPDGQRLVTISERNSLQIWSAETGKSIGEPLTNHGTLVGLAFGPDGKRIVKMTATHDKKGTPVDYTVQLWDAETNRAIGKPFNTHDWWLRTVVLSPDGKRIITTSVGGIGRLWDVATGQPIGEPFKSHQSPEPPPGSAVFSRDGKRAVVPTEDKTAILWDAETAKPVGRPLKGHLDQVYGVAFSPDGKRVVTASGDGTARVWDVEPEKRAPLRHGDDVNSVAFSPDGKLVVTASSDRTARVWDAGTGKPVGKPLADHDGAVRSAAFSPDGKRIVTASEDKRARLWDAETGQQIGEPLTGHQDDVSAAFSPDGSRIVTTSDDGGVLMWNAQTGKLIGEPLKPEIATGRKPVGSDGKLIVTSDHDNTAQLWDANTGKPVGQALKHDRAVEKAVIGPDGTRILTIGFSTAQLWDAAAGKAIGLPLKVKDAPDAQQRIVVDRATNEIQTLEAAFSSDGKRILVATSGPGYRRYAVRLLDTETGKPISEPFDINDLTVTSVAFSRDGKRIASASLDDTARVWDIFATTQDFVSHAKAAAPRCLSPEQRAEFFLPAEPPAWCIEMEKWPYHTREWKEWLTETRAGKNSQLPVMRTP